MRLSATYASSYLKSEQNPPKISQCFALANFDFLLFLVSNCDLKLDQYLPLISSCLSYEVLLLDSNKICFVVNTVSERWKIAIIIFAMTLISNFVLVATAGGWSY